MPVPTRGPDAPPARGEPPDPGTAILAVVRKAQELTPAEARRLGRWTSASLRDPRLARPIEAARVRAMAVLDEERSRRKRWETASRPLYAGLVAAASDDRRWRVIMLAAHFAALLAIVNLPAGLPPIVAALFVLSAPASAWAAWGRGTQWLGAIQAALAAAAGDRLGPDDVAVLRRAWTNAVESDPPVPPPTLGAIGALAPSTLLVIAFVVVLVFGVPR
ncbi:MAG TPA: hypothetical protein VFO73_15615 [Candidatus Limnocylindrales bacterium]|nr:hypothetical protein [Candidatus Limnocylindrales bacterium]